MKAKVDAETCIGCGLCAADCPEVFMMNDESIAKVIVDAVPAEHKDSCRNAAANCPVEAIKITD